MLRTTLTRSLVALCVLWVCAKCRAGDDKPGNQDGKPKLPDRVYVRMATSKGDIFLELNYEKAPISTKNFLDYVDSGHYNGTIFHRVMDNFMIQGGGFDRNRKERKGKSPIRNEWQNGLKNRRGTIAMARTTAPDSATCQFFINVRDNSNLDVPYAGGGNAAYAVFGKVIKGMDVVDKIKSVPVKSESGFEALPIEPVIIERVTRVKPEELRSEIAEARRIEEEETRANKEKFARLLADGISFVKARGADVSKGQQTPSGLWYVDLKPGKGDSPGPGSTVKVHYTGWLPNGTKFDSSRDRKEPIEKPLGTLIPGWNEGLRTMKAGGRRFLVIPPELGYGPRGAGSIPPNAVLVFDIELLELKQR